MSLGEVKPATDEDFARLKSMALETTGWISVYSTNNSFVWTKQNELSPFNMIKVFLFLGLYDIKNCQVQLFTTVLFMIYSQQSKAYYSDVSADILYDVLHDPLYRKVWDPTILEGREICKIDNNNDIGYYASMYFITFFSYTFLFQIFEVNFNFSAVTKASSKQGFFDC